MGSFPETYHEINQYQQVIAGYDDGLDPRQPRDLHVPEYTSLVRMLYTATCISRKVVGKNMHATIAKGNMGYDQYTVPDTVAVEPTFAAFL